MTQSCGSHKETPYSTNSAAVRSPPLTASTNASDASALGQKVEAALSSDAGLKGSAIKVAVGPEGLVVLSGEVASREQSEKAAEIAKAVPGVGVVRNLMRVTSGKSNDAAKGKPR
jgi:osmotically-inducible protein OsmY